MVLFGEAGQVASSSAAFCDLTRIRRASRCHQPGLAEQRDADTGEAWVVRSLSAHVIIPAGGRFIPHWRMSRAAN